ncbi:hypothetical protein N0V90_002940 [Kalmusia sp. IMI 367209]|nr:hypothetical protein N0V90_002940 [Kalmusia sp. IMI 367209]
MPSYKATLALLAALSSVISNARADTQCPGVLQGGSNDNDQLCCVGATLVDINLSTCPGWPLCTGPATASQEPQPPLSCAEVIPVTASDYDEKISKASASLEASGTHYQTTLADGDVTAAPAPTSGVASETRGGSSSAESSSPAPTRPAASSTGGGSSVESAGASSTASTGGGNLARNVKVEAAGGMALLLALAV